MYAGLFEYLLYMIRSLSNRNYRLNKQRLFMWLRMCIGFSIDSCVLCVTRGLLPTELVEAVWDPLSTSQTLRLVGLLSRLIQEYPTVLPSSRPLEQLVSAVIAKMKSAVENDIFIPIYSKQ